MNRLNAITLDQNLPMSSRQNALTKPFWEGLKADEIRTTQCAQCAHITFPPKKMCPQCGSDNMSWIPLSGKGTLYSVTIVHAAPPSFAADAPYTVAIVDTEENVRLIARLLCDTDNMPKLDTPVDLVVLHYKDGDLFGAVPRET